MVQVDARVGVKIVYGCPLSELALALGLMMLFEAYCLLEMALSNRWMTTNGFLVSYDGCLAGSARL
jgi:hypothetical protein